ncbi:MAG TPA: cytochrome c-type biogenesis protein CcmH [Rhodospirillaceae bacterium]|nr:cytochrome c-type biogenesis protein CcmH [Rhodospirillaceae bacterium]
MKWLFAVGFLVLLAVAPAGAVQPDEFLKDPALESRARELGKDLRCLVCQNQSIDDSDADLARDLRVLLRQRLVAGDSDSQAKQFIVDRYGDYVLLNPPFKAGTVALWAGPGIFLLLALLAATVYLRRRAAAAKGSEAATPLSDSEQQRLAALLKDDKTS